MYFIFLYSWDLELYNLQVLIYRKTQEKVYLRHHALNLAQGVLRKTNEDSVAII